MKKLLTLLLVPIFAFNSAVGLALPKESYGDETKIEKIWSYVEKIGEKHEEHNSIITRMKCNNKDYLINLVNKNEVRVFYLAELIHGILDNYVGDYNNDGLKDGLDDKDKYSENIDEWYENALNNVHSCLPKNKK